MDPVKVAGVEGWKPPKNLTELRGFTGFINFYRPFIKGFSQEARPLNDLTKKDTPWEWTPERQQAFEKLKVLVCNEPVLLMPKLQNPFELEVDASSFAIGATLSQQDEWERWHPVAFVAQHKAQHTGDVSHLSSKEKTLGVEVLCVCTSEDERRGCVFTTLPIGGFIYSMTHPYPFTQK